MKPIHLAVALLIAVLSWNPAAPTREALGDDALDRLLEQVGGPDQPKDETAPAAEGESAHEEATPPAELTTEDKALDDLLEKLGQTEETPAPDDHPRGPAPPSPGPDELTTQDQKIDERLEELLGRKHRKPEEEQDGEGGDDPLSQAIKRMREVEKRLSEPDTGEETRKRQEQIVKDLDTILDQIRSMKGQPGKPGTKIVAEIRRQGRTSQPGNRQGANPGSNPGQGMMTGTKFPKPSKFFDPKDKDVWGHLQDDLKGELDNVSRERFLPTREELIRRYYEAVAKKSRAREN